MPARSRRVGAIAIVCSGLVMPAWAGEATDCDRLAASPYDPARLAPGVSYQALDAAAAVAACRDDLARWPDQPRVAFQLGRALLKAGAGEEGLALYRQAAEAGYLPAVHNIAALYAEGQVVKQDLGHALRLYLLAAEAGFAPSQFSLGLCYLAGQGIIADREKGLSWIRLAAAQDFQPARDWLAANQQALTP